MRKYEMKVCRRCKKMYRWSTGGIVLTPEDHADYGLCEECRSKTLVGVIQKIVRKR